MNADGPYIFHLIEAVPQLNHVRIISQILGADPRQDKAARHEVSARCFQPESLQQRVRTDKCNFSKTCVVGNMAPALGDPRVWSELWAANLFMMRVTILQPPVGGGMSTIVREVAENP